MIMFPMVAIVIIEINLQVLQLDPPVSVYLISRDNPPLASDGLNQVHPAHLLSLALELVLHVGLELVIRLGLVLEYV